MDSTLHASRTLVRRRNRHTAPWRWLAGVIALAGVAATAPAAAANPATAPITAPTTAPALSYADLADLTLAAPVIVRATIKSAERIATGDSPGLAVGKVRLLVTATVDAALVAPGAVPPVLRWLWDAPLDERGRAPRPKGEIALAWIGTPGADGKATLVSARGQQPWSSAIEARVRAIATEMLAGTAPVVTGVSNGFRVPGTVEGESESQFFLSLANGHNVTMVVISRPGQARRVTLSNGDVIDESAAEVQPQTLGWYRLACALPANLPPAVMKGDDSAALAADWKAALASLGSCGRTS